MLYKTNRKLPWILALNDRQLRKPSMVISDALSWATFKLDLEVDIFNFEFSTQLWPMKHPHQLTFSASVGLHFSSTLLKQHKPNYTRCYIWFSQFLFSHGAYESVDMRCKKIWVLADQESSARGSVFRKHWTSALNNSGQDFFSEILALS